MPLATIVPGLQERTAPERFSLWSRPKEAFIGKVDAHGFKLRRNISYRNSFIPVVSGEFEVAGSTTLIHLRMGLHPLVMVFICVWMGAVGLATMAVAYGSIHTGRINPVVFVPAGMFLFGYALTMGGFLFERGRTLDELERALSAVRITPVKG